MAKKIKEYKKIFSETQYSEKLLSDYYECVNSNTNGNFLEIFYIFDGNSLILTLTLLKRIFRSRYISAKSNCLNLVLIV